MIGAVRRSYAKGAIQGLQHARDALICKQETMTVSRWFRKLERSFNVTRTPKDMWMDYLLSYIEDPSPAMTCITRYEMRQDAD